MNQLRSSRTKYGSATNPNICKFVSIRRIRGLCGIGVLQVSRQEYVNENSISQPNMCCVYSKEPSQWDIGSNWDIRQECPGGHGSLTWDLTHEELLFKTGLSPPVKYFTGVQRRYFSCGYFMGTFLSCVCYASLCVRLFICALLSPAGKGLTSWLSFVVYNCEFVTFPLVSLVRCGTWLYRFLIFAPLLTLKTKYLVIALVAKCLQEGKMGNICVEVFWIWTSGLGDVN